MPLISTFLPARLSDEKFSNFERYIAAMFDNLSDKNNLELCIKFDDDQDISKAVAVIESYQKRGMQIKYIHTPRGRGYQDLSLCYIPLYFIASPESKLFFLGGSIDMVIKKKDFDVILLEAAKKFPDEIFVMHTTSHSDFSETNDLQNLVQCVDAFPVWSRKWVEIQGAFGYSAYVEGYSAMVEFFLYKEYGIDRRIDLTDQKLIKETDNGGFVDSAYWQGPRKKSIQMHLTEQSVTFARQAARNLALNITNSWKKDDYINYLIHSCMKVYDENLLLDRIIRLEIKSRRLKNRLRSFFKSCFYFSKKLSNKITKK